MIFDTHAHVNFKAFSEDADEVVKRALSEGVWMNNVGTQIDISREAVEMAEKYPEGVYAIVGLHPVHTYSQHVDEEESSFQTREEKFDYEAYKQLALNPKVVGIGECGLDYYRIKNDELGIRNTEQIKNLQKEAFVKQINLAKELDKTLVIHSRSSQGTDDACLDILEILKSELKSSLHLIPSPLRFVLHSYTGSPEVAAKFVEIGAYISFNEIITFGDRKNKNSLTSAEA